LKSAIVLISILALIAVLNGSVYAGPALDISERECDFGFVPQNSKMTYTFYIRSTGDEDLKVNSISTGCGCTRAPLDKDIIAPGDSAKLEIIFSSRRFRGKINKFPVIFTNTPKKVDSLEVKAYVLDNPGSTESIRINPFGIDYEDFDLYAEEIEFEIKNISDHDFKLKMISAPEDYLTIDMPGEIRSGQEDCWNGWNCWVVNIQSID